MSHEVDFLHADKHKSLPQIDTMIFKVPKIASLQCLQHFKKQVRNEVAFLHADKHQSFLQVDTIIIDWHDQAFSKYSK